MGKESLAITTKVASVAKASKHHLWVTENNVLTVTLDKNCLEFPPTPAHCFKLNQMIQGLARASKAVLFQAENDAGIDGSFATQPMTDIADAIILLSQLSEAVRSECSEVMS